MPNIRLIAAAAVAAALACLPAPASARSCDDGNESCVSLQSAPMKLDQFMKTWKPVGTSRKHAKKPAAVLGVHDRGRIEVCGELRCDAHRHPILLTSRNASSATRFSEGGARHSC